MNRCLYADIMQVSIEYLVTQFKLHDQNSWFSPLFHNRTITNLVSYKCIYNDSDPLILFADHDYLYQNLVYVCMYVCVCVWGGGIKNQGILNNDIHVLLEYLVFE